MPDGRPRSPGPRLRPAALAMLLAAAAGPALAQEKGDAAAERAAVALMLYGARDPDAITAAGLHGLAGRLVPVALSKVGPCRFAVAAGDRRETIDFTAVEALRYRRIADPAAGLAAAVTPRPGGAVRELALVVLAGTARAVCDDEGCRDGRVFALRDADRLAEAQAAAAAFRGQVCPGPATTPAPIPPR